MICFLARTPLAPHGLISPAAKLPSPLRPCSSLWHERKWAMPAKMTAKQAAFAREYSRDFNATAAAKRAGYAPIGAHVQGSALLKHPLVKAEVDRLTAAAVHHVNITRQWLENKTLSALANAEADRHHSAVKGLIDLLAKLSGNLIERREVRQITGIGDLTDEELRAIAAEGRRPPGEGTRH
jgi:Terminase small subunit